MEATKKERAMTEKGWLQRASGKAGKSAAGFIQAHRAWLETGSLAQFTSPLLQKLDQGELFPTSCLETLKSVVLGHLLAKEQSKAEQVMNQPAKTPKQYEGTVYDSHGNICQDAEGKDLTFSSDQSGEVERWADRRLIDGAPDWFATVVNTKMFTPEGEAYTQTILRDDSLARLLRPKKGPASRQTSKTTSKLSWGMKVAGGKPTHFSHG